MGIKQFKSSVLKYIPEQTRSKADNLQNVRFVFAKEAAIFSDRSTSATGLTKSLSRCKRDIEKWDRKDFIIFYFNFILFYFIFKSRWIYLSYISGWWMKTRFTEVS